MSRYGAETQRMFGIFLRTVTTDKFRTGRAFGKLRTSVD